MKFLLLDKPFIDIYTMLLSLVNRFIVRTKLTPYRAMLVNGSEADSFYFPHAITQQQN